MTVDDPQLLNRARLLQARSLIAEWSPFLGHLVLQMPVRIAAEGPGTTAWVDGHGTCTFHRDFLSTLSPAEAATILVHETLHLALDAFPRRENRDPRLWNMAHDLVVNQLIEDTRARGQSLPWPKAHPPLLHPEFKDLAAEQAYDLLWDALSLPRKSDPWPGHPGEAPPERQAEIRATWGESRLEAAEEMLPRVIDLDLQEGPGASPEEREALRRRWQEGLLSAAERALEGRSIGDLPSWAQRLLAPLLQPQVPWSQVLARRIHGHLRGARRSFARPGRRSHALGVAMPGTLRDRGTVGVFVDVSGSIDNATLGAFFTELQGILEGTGHAVRLMTWDTAVGLDLALEDADALRRQTTSCTHIPGGGGTDPRCVIERLIATDDLPLPAFGVLLTDGYVPWPAVSDWPLDLIVVSTGPLPPAGLGYDALPLAP